MDSGIESTESSNGSISDSCMNVGDIQHEELNKATNGSTTNVSLTVEETLSETENCTLDYPFREPCNISNVKLRLKKINKNNLEMSIKNISKDKSINTCETRQESADVILPPYLPVTAVKSYSVTNSSNYELLEQFGKSSKLDSEMGEDEKFSEFCEPVPKPIFPNPVSEVSMMIPIFKLNKIPPDLPVPEGCCLKLNFSKFETAVCMQEQTTPLEFFPKFSFANGPMQISCNPQPYTGSLAVLPYESRELQRKFKHYRHRLKQIISTKPKEKKLRIGAGLNNVELVERLLQEGVNPKATDERQRTALHIAASKGYTKIVKLLLQNGADPNQKDSIGNTALHLAACTSHIETVTLLLKAGTDIKQADNQGYSPLHLANSRLKLLQKDPNPSSRELRIQVYQIVEMMQEYLKSSGNPEEAELLEAWTSKLSLSDSGSQGENDNIKQLLTSLQDLTLSKTKKD